MYVLCMCACSACEGHSVVFISCCSSGSVLVSFCQCLSLDWRVPKRPHRVASEPLGSTCLCLPTVGVVSTHHHALLKNIAWVWKLGPRTCKASTLFTELAIPNNSVSKGLTEKEGGFWVRWVHNRELSSISHLTCILLSPNLSSLGQSGYQRMTTDNSNLVSRGASGTLFSWDSEAGSGEGLSAPCAQEAPGTQTQTEYLHPKWRWRGTTTSGTENKQSS